MAAAFIGAVAVHSLATAYADATSTAAGTTASSTASSLQGQIDASNQQIQSLNEEIAADQAALQQAGADKKTLQAAINSLTSSAPKCRPKWP